MAFQDKSGNGLKNLYSMVSYCLNESQCRRKLIAKYFDEVWQSHDCNQMCDVCTRSSTNVTKRNCREEALIIIDYFKNNKKARLTGLQLLDTLGIKTMAKIDLQKLILQMIVDQYLQEHFRFTSYSTICYIKLGPQSESVRKENSQVLIDIIETTDIRPLTTRRKNEKKTVRKKSPVQGKMNEIFKIDNKSSPFESTRLVSKIIYVLESRPKLQSVTNTDVVAKSTKRKQRTLNSDDDDDIYDDEKEDEPISKKTIYTIKSKC